MLIQRVFSPWSASLISRRFISQSTRRFESKISDTSKVSSTASEYSASSSVVGSKMVAPSGWEKWVLVWMKKYPKGQVPDRVKEEVMYQTKSRARVKMANYMTAFAAVLCFGAAYISKKARDEGDGLHKRNVEWHKQLNEEHRKKIKAES